MAKKKELPDRQITGGGWFNASRRNYAVKKFIRQLGEDPGTITGLAVVGHRTAVRMVAKRFQRHLHDGMATFPFNMRYKTDTTASCSNADHKALVWVAVQSTVGGLVDEFGGGLLRLSCLST